VEEKSVAVSNKRERELARQRYERQQKRRMEARHKVVRRRQVLASVLSVLMVIGGVAFLATQMGGDDKENASAKSTPSASATPSTTPSATPTTKPGECSYRPAPAAGTVKPKYVGMPPTKINPKVPYTATIKTNQGTITMDLWTDKAPCAVNSFKFLADKNFYDNTPCHRMLVGAAGNVLQCGDPSGTGTGGSGYQFAEENLTGAKYTKGIVALAKTASPNSSGSQFFMNFGDSGFAPDYTPFGMITSGLDVLVKISKGGVDGPQNDHPKTKVIITDVTVAAKK
jgi:peptidyl-prolyl cis-trans isomerase B (cyclophilin B)